MRAAKKLNNLGITQIGLTLAMLSRGMLTFNAFCRDVIQVEPTWQQQQFIDAWDDGHRDITVRSGHGPGKSTVLGWFVVFYLLSYKDALVPITGSAFDQVKKTLWKEVTRAYRRLPMKAKQQLEKYTTELKRADNPEESFAFIRTADDPDNFSGFHSPHMVFIVDEASAVDDGIYEVIEGARTQADNALIMAGNPTQLKGEFYDSHHRNRSLYKCLHWNGEKSPLVTPERIERQRKKYGPESNEYKIRVLGDFPDSAESSLMSLADIEACVALHAGTVDESGPLVYGVDVGRQGDDPSVICKRKGQRVFKTLAKHNMKGPAVAGWVQGHRKDDERAGTTPASINVDVIGIGASAYDQLDLDSTCPVQDVNVALQGDKYVEEPDRFLNLRAELYWWLKVDVEAHEIAIDPEDVELIEELATIRYEFTAKGLIKIEDKDRMKDKRRLGRSPDRADALMLTYYKPNTVFSDLLEMAIGG